MLTLMMTLRRWRTSNSSGQRRDVLLAAEFVAFQRNLTGMMGGRAGVGVRVGGPRSAWDGGGRVDEVCSGCWQICICFSRVATRLEAQTEALQL